jgi:hypothetical protein
MLLVTAQIINRGRNMNDQSASTATMESLEATFGGRWGIWLSDTGRWWAARRSALSAAELSAGCVPFLRADDPAQLSARIQAQEELSSRSDGYIA